MKKNKTMGFLPTTLDRTIFLQRNEKIRALPPIAQCIVLEWEKEFSVSVASGPLFSTIFDNVVNAFENQFKTTNLVVPALYANCPLTSNFFTYVGGRFYFLRNLFNMFACARYTAGNYNVPFTMFAVTPYTISYVGSFENLKSLNLDGSSIQLVSRIVHIAGDASMGVDVWKMLNLKTDGVDHVTNSFSVFTGLNGYWYTSITPAEFFATMRLASATIKWLESENNDMSIMGVVDGVKVAQYETVLNSQLTYINNLSDIVANNNILLISDGQKHKDSINALITAKKAEIESIKAEKRKNIATMENISSNTDSIISSQKLLITNQIFGK
jgi:hypothetical protein